MVLVETDETRDQIANAWADVYLRVAQSVGLFAAGLLVRWLHERRQRAVEGRDR